MSTPQVPEPKWVDFDDDIERFGREAQEIWNRIYPSHPTPWVISNQQDQPLFNGLDPLDPAPHIPPAIFGAPHPDPQPLSVAWLPNDSTMLTPIVSSGLIESPGGISTDQVPSVFSADALWDTYPSELPQTPRLETIPLPPVDFEYDNGSNLSGYGNDDGGSDYFLYRGLSEHQPTLEWVGTSSHEDEGPMGSGTPEPKMMEENRQSEQPSGSDPSGSKGGFDRAQNGEGKKQCLAQIREALGIPPKESELLTLQKAIKHLGGSVPQREESSTWLSKPQRQAKKLAEIRECFDVLKGLVGPLTAKPHDLKVLKNVLARVTAQVVDTQSSEEAYQPYGVFRAW